MSAVVKLNTNAIIYSKLPAITSARLEANALPTLPMLFLNGLLLINAFEPPNASSKKNLDKMLLRSIIIPVIWGVKLMRSAITINGTSNFSVIGSFFIFRFSIVPTPMTSKMIIITMLAKSRTIPHAIATGLKSLLSGVYPTEKINCTDALRNSTETQSKAYPITFKAKNMAPMINANTLPITCIIPLAISLLKIAPASTGIKTNTKINNTKKHSNGVRFEPRRVEFFMCKIYGYRLPFITFYYIIDAYKRYFVIHSVCVS